MRRTWLALALTAGACSGDPSGGATAAQDATLAEVADDDARDDVDPLPTCPVGHAVDGTGACHGVGPPGCDPRFVGADGLCRPSVAACDPGTIPHQRDGLSLIHI